MTVNSIFKKRLFVAPALILFLLGCGPDINVKDVDRESRPPNTGKLDIYNSVEEVKRPYKTIKLVRVEDDRVAARQDEEQMKRETFANAKEMGADGLIIMKTGTRNYRVRDGMGGSVPYSAKFIEFEAIIYLDK
ncbi:hypothetical protein N9219_01405 [bacterium]|nr:hypothetical protein [bacterium]